MLSGTALRSLIIATNFLTTLHQEFVRERERERVQVSSMGPESQGEEEVTTSLICDIDWNEFKCMLVLVYTGILFY